MPHKYLFVLCPPFSGSTVLWRLLQTSPNVSALPREGQYVDSVKAIMRADPWNPDNRMPWPKIKEEWSKLWNLEKPVLLEKSPPNLLRAKEIAEVFAPSWFVVMIRDPYAQCEGLMRRRKRLAKVFGHVPSRAEVLAFAAERWMNLAARQIENIQTLERVISFTYEELTANASAVAERLTAFLPDLGALDAAQRFRSHAATGSDSRVLVNMNEIKWRSLRKRDIEAINAVLAKRPDLLAFFGYRLRQPDRLQDLHSAIARTTALIAQVRSAGKDAALQVLRPPRKGQRAS